MTGSISSILSLCAPCRPTGTGKGEGAASCLTWFQATLPLLAVFALGFSTAANGQTVHTFKTDAPVERIIATATGAFIIAGEQVFAVVRCNDDPGLCLEPSAPPPEADAAPTGALPDGRIAVIDTGDIRQAWFARPTTRYAHGVLGDAIEAGSLVAVTSSGSLYEAILPDDQVFEDITPRIADLDGDGTNEIIAIRSSRGGGAAVAIFGLSDDDLTLRGAGSENGRANRWLNIAGLVPGPNGGLTLYGVRTPHINGRLFSLDFRDGQLTERNDIASDLSNHIIGSRELGMSATGQFGGHMQLVLPSQDHSQLRFPLTGYPDIALPSAINKAIALVNGHLVTATEDGTLIFASP